jgi:hypothetical protein
MIKKEYEYYREHQDELARKYENKVVLIRGEKVVEVYDTYRQAKLDLYKKHQYETYFLQKCIKRSSEYPKLIAIGWQPIRETTEISGTFIYLLEDEELFHAYAQDPRYYPRVKCSIVDAVALRWFYGIVPPKGDEDVHKLYREAMDILYGDDKLVRSLTGDGSKKRWFKDVESVKNQSKHKFAHHNDNSPESIAMRQALKHFL